MNERGHSTMGKRRRKRRAPSPARVHSPGCAHGRLERAVAWLTLFVFFVSPATAAHAGKTTTAIGNADTKDGRFTENTDERTTFDQNKKRAVIRWDVMDQKADNTLTFVQGKKQSVLNQASGVSMSVFRGMVKCSGSCVFANEAGVLFADGSYLDVGKLVAVAGNVDEGAFRAGRIHATNLFGEVENQGVIHAGAAALIGSRITNGGEIVVDDGTLTMVVGEEVWMRNHGSNVVIRSALPPAGSPESSDTDFDDTPAIENTGTLRAGDGRVRMLAGDMLSFAIRNQGEIQAREIRLEAGDDGLVEVGGGSLLDASNQAVGARGGKIKVLGGYVAIVDDAVLDASGDSGGGKILVGGNRGGRGKTRTAKGTFVGAGTTLRADATRKGDGGKVIVWSDGTTRAYGEISAQGGIEGGDGGFVETSGLEYLDVLSSPLISARSGRAEDRGGKWLIDPYDIDIVDGCGATSECLDERLEEASTYDPEIVFEAKIRPGDASDTPSEIDGRLIEQVLLGGADVTITTNGRGKKLGGDPGDIRLLTDLFFDGDGTDDAVAGTESTLKLRAADDIILDGDATSALGAIVNLDSNLTLNLDFRANNGQSELEAASGEFAGEYLGDLELNDHIITGGGAVSLSGVNVTLDANIETAGGSVTVLAEGGDATLNADIDTTHSDPDESGGGVLVAALGRVVEDPDDKKRDVVRGGDIHVSSDTNIDTDGGSVTVSAGNRQLASLSDAFGGNLFFDGDIDSGTGRVSLEAFRARKKTDNGTSQFGGELVYDENASIETDGAAVDISVSIDSRSGTRSDNNTRVRIFGDIDTNATADSDAGGGVEILSNGLVGKIEIGDTQSGDAPVITTGGGDVRISSNGKLSFVRGSIDARFDGVQDPEEDDIEGDVAITVTGLMSIRSEGAEDIEIQGDALVQLAGALDGASNLRIETPTSGVKLSAEKIELHAGNGLGNFDTAQVDLSSATNALQFSNSDETGNPLELTIAQDADLTTANNLPAAGQFQTGTLELESLTLQSFDGHLDLDGFAAETSDTMTLGAREGIIADSATLTATGKLEIEVYEDFTVSAGLASTLSANPPSELKITTGTLGGFRNGSDAGLEVEGNLTATDSLELHAGAGGSGDLTFTSNPTLTSNEITLWAGDGSASNSGPEVVVVDVMDPDDLGDDVGLVDFDLGGTTNRSFTLRQSAAIERDTIPLASQFADGIDDLDYTLRSDGGSIGGEDEINTAKLLDTNLSVHALAGVDATYTDGAADAALRVRSLDIGGTQDFTYTREHNDTYELDDGGGETILVIRAGISGSGDLRFDGEPEDQNDDSDFVIEADEIRLVAGDGLGGQITSRVILAATAANAPIFRDHTDDGDGNDAVRRFVFRQDAPIQATDVARVDEVFDGIAPLLHVIHSDYDSSVDSGSPQSAIQFLSPDIIASAQDKLIVSGESVDVFADESYDLTEYFDEDEVGDAMSLEIRTDTLTLAADDNDDQENSTPIGITIDPTRLVLRDFAREQTDEEAEQFVPEPFDITGTPDTTPNIVSIAQEAEITAAEVTNLRDVLNVNVLGGGSDPDRIKRHDAPVDDPDEDPTILLLQSLEGNISIEPVAVADLDLRLTVYGEDAEIDFDRSAAYMLENLIVSADHGLTFGSTATVGPPNLDLTVQDVVEISSGNGGSDGDLDFAENVLLSANKIGLRAGISGALASDDETPRVDAATNAPEFVLTNQADAGDPADTHFEIRQDAGFVDVAANATHGESLLPAASQFTGADPIGVMQLISEDGDISIERLSETLAGVDDGGLIEHLVLQAGTLDSLGRRVLTIEDRSTLDTDLTLYDSIDLTAHEILLAADGLGAVYASDPDVVFRDVPTSSGDPMRFTLRHQAAHICEGSANTCAGGAVPDLDQFASAGAGRPIDFTLVSQLGQVEITSQIARKLVAGNNSFPVRADLTVLGNNAAGTGPDVVISANQSGRASDIQLESLTIGRINDTTQVSFVNADGEEVAVSTTGDQHYYGQVEVENAAALTGNTVHFAEDVSSDGEASLTLNVREQLQIDANIVFVRSPGGPESAVRVNMDPSADGTARVVFNADGLAQRIQADRVDLFAPEEDDLDRGTAYLPKDTRRSAAATIAKRQGDLTFDVDAFRMSEGEKLSVGGNLAIGDDASTLAMLSDLSAVAIDVVAETIVLVLRSAGDYLGIDGQTHKDGGLDIVANTIDFEGEIETVGNGEKPLFGVRDPFTADADLDPFPVAALTPDNGRIRASDFTLANSDRVPDLHPEGAVRDDFSNVYFGPEIVPAPDAWRADASLATQTAHLARIDIELQQDTARATRSRVGGASIIDDVGSDLPDRASAKIRVSTSRVLSRDAQQVAERHARLFGEDGSQAPRVRQILQDALDDYLAESGARRVLGFELRRYLRNRPSSQFDAYTALEDLDALFSYHRNLGLTPGEYTRIQQRWLVDIQPEGISLEELAEAVHPSRFVRGSDILDIFGD